jgi:hypothetical protein
LVWQTNSQSKAKIAWDIAILPLTRGGIKILDPKDQITTLFTKMLMKGLNLGPEPWKILLHHRVDNMTQCFKRHCHPLIGWFMSTKKNENSKLSIVARHLDNMVEGL